MIKQLPKLKLLLRQLLRQLKQLLLRLLKLLLLVLLHILRRLVNFSVVTHKRGLQLRMTAQQDLLHAT